MQTSGISSCEVYDRLCFWFSNNYSYTNWNMHDFSFEKLEVSNEVSEYSRNYFYKSLHLLLLQFQIYALHDL